VTGGHYREMAGKLAQSPFMRKELADLARRYAHHWF